MNRVIIEFERYIHNLFPSSLYNKPKSKPILTIKYIGFHKEFQHRRWELYIGDGDRFASGKDLPIVIKKLEKKIASLTPDEFSKLILQKTKQFIKAEKRLYSDCNYDIYIIKAMRHIWKSYKYKLTIKEIAELLHWKKATVAHYLTIRKERMNRQWILNNIEELANVFDATVLDVIKLAQTLYWIDKEKEKRDAVHKTS